MALGVLDEMPRRELQADMISCSAEISTCGKGWWRQLLYLSHCVQRQSKVPGKITFNSLIIACEKGKQPERALQPSKAMTQQAVVPKGITYSTLTRACEKGKQPRRALQPSRAMNQQGVVPGVIAYSALTSVCEKGVQSERALQLSNAMKQQVVLMRDGPWFIAGDA